MPTILGIWPSAPCPLIARNCGGALPAANPDGEDDAQILAAARDLPAALRACIDRQALNEALGDGLARHREANAYIDRQAPWALRKTDFSRMEAVLRVLADVLRQIATVLQPFMPGSMARMLDQLGVPPDARAFASLNAPLPAGTTLPPPEGVFPRLVEHR